MSWSVRSARPEDADTIIDFNCRLASESEGKTLDPDLIRPGVQRGLADPNKALYFVAETEQSQLIGQIMVTFEWSDWRNGWIWWIQSVYVHVDHRRQGVFRSLYQHVKDQAKSQPDVIALRLYVDDDNTAAQETYYRLGMVKSSYFVLEQYPL